MYTLNDIQTAPSYSALVRNGFTDVDVLNYYKLAPNQRSTFFKSVTSSQKEVATPKVDVAPKVVKASTQKCTSNSHIPTLNEVKTMALEHMAKDWVYSGRTFNMNDMGWRFEFNDRKRALGLCSHREKTIYLSNHFIKHNTREMKMWVNTMVHEIAHVINRELGGKGHDWKWRNIFVSFGGDGNRTNGDAQFENIIEKPISKYTTICPNGHAKPSYKKSKTIEQGRQACAKCCNEHNYGRFSKEFVLKQIQNY